jgi:nucleoside-diphosphate-sugar epimerase
MSVIVITGANGFVGSHILEAAASETGHRWIAACRRPDKLPGEFDGEVRSGDLRDEGYRVELLNDVDVVIHAAAWTSLWGHRKQSRALYYKPSAALLEAAAEAGVKRFVFLSTTSAAPSVASGAGESGVQPKFWPHLCNVTSIENRMRELASERTTMVSLRCGLFAGKRYNLGLLPILLPRLKTHLVPWIAGGRTSMPIVSGHDLGRAFVSAAVADDLNGYEQFQIVGPEVPTVRQVIDYLHADFGYPRPHFSVPFPAGYGFAALMERLDTLVPWEPLVVRSIIHLLEETRPDNGPAMERLGYQPEVGWKTAIAEQLAEMRERQQHPMKMAVSTGDEAQWVE